jgi:hypothetical protein
MPSGKRGRLSSAAPAAAFDVQTLPSSATAASFWSAAVSPRLPALLPAACCAGFTSAALTQPAALLAAVGDAAVWAELPGAGGGFGGGRRLRLPFSAFAARLGAREGLYLTTQPLALAGWGLVALWHAAWPLCPSPSHRTRQPAEWPPPRPSSPCRTLRT